MQRLILAEACFFAQFGWTLLILCRCSAAPNSLDSPLKSLILYALALILHALYPGPRDFFSARAIQLGISVVTSNASHDSM